MNFSLENFSLDGHFTRFELRVFALVAIAFVTAWYRPLLANRFFSAVEHWGSRLARRRTLCCMAMAALLIVLRLALWPIEKLPLPTIQDEFSYLLAADTFSHARLTNPTPTHWIFFETVFENMRPTYMSKYPPAQGAALAVGQLLGHPWLGVLLSVAVMCAAITWMLQGWLPARWALLGGLLVVTRFFFAFGYEMNYWLESYWGGAIPALGGALALGALPRMLRRRSAVHGALLGAGVALLLFSRPYEGIVLCVPLGSAIALRVLRGRATLGTLFPSLGAAACVLAAAGALLAYYNWRGTGNPLLMPYVVNDRDYLSTPNFVWQEMGAPIHYRNPQFDAAFNGWCRFLWTRDRLTLSWNGIRWGLMRKLDLLQGFYLPGVMGLAVLATLWWLVRNRKARFLLAVCACTLAGLLLVVWFQRHYAAPATAAAFGLSLLALRYLRTWKPGGRPVGIGMSRAFVIVWLVLVPLNMSASFDGHSIQNRPGDWALDRARFEERLNALPGRHLVVVRYGPNHHPGQEWVFNRAEICEAKVVWVREIPGEDLAPLFAEFKDRQVWTADVDARPRTLDPFLERPVAR